MASAHELAAVKAEVKHEREQLGRLLAALDGQLGLLTQSAKVLDGERVELPGLAAIPPDLPPAEGVERFFATYVRDEVAYQKALNAINAVAIKGEPAEQRPTLPWSAAPRW